MPKFRLFLWSEKLTQDKVGGHFCRQSPRATFLHFFFIKMAEKQQQLQDFFSPFIQPFTPHGSPSVNFIQQDFSKLESPMMPEIDLLSPPPSFQMMPYGSYIPPLDLRDHNYQQSTSNDIPITPSQLLRMNNNNSNTGPSDGKKPFKSHREAEQKRRDVLKNQFMECKAILPKMKANPSKVAILKKSRKYIQELKTKLEDEQRYCHELRAVIAELNSRVENPIPIPTKNVSLIVFEDSDE